MELSGLKVRLPGRLMIRWGWADRTRVASIDSRVLKMAKRPPSLRGQRLGLRTQSQEQNGTWEYQTQWHVL